MDRIDTAATASPGRLEAASERGKAAVGYGLVVASLFTVWLTGAAAFWLAWLHRRSPDPVARSHFRWQLLAADLAGFAVAIGATLVVWALLLVGGPLLDGAWPSLADFGGAAGLALVGVGLFAASFAGTLAAAAWGAWRLLRGREAPHLRLPHRRARD